MKIKTKLLCVSLLSAITAVAVGVSLLWAYQRISELLVNEGLIHTIVQDVFELNILTNDYLLYHEDRPQKQWQAKHNKLSSLLAGLEFKDPEKESSLNKMRDTCKQIKTLFNRLVTQKKSLERGKKTITNERIEERLVSQLLMKTQKMVTDTFRLEDREKLLTVQRVSNLQILALTVVLSMATAIMSFIVMKSITKPISVLIKGSEIIGKGDLAHRVDIKTDDEVGEMAAAFNQMAEKRQRFEVTLHESEQKYKTLIESSLTGIFIHQDDKYVFVNNRFAEMHGYNPEELIGKNHYELVHLDQRKKIKQRAYERLQGKKAPKTYEIKRLRKDGKTAWHEIMVSDPITYQGKPAIMGHEVDITERKNAEQQNIEQNNLLNGINNVLIGALNSDSEDEVAFTCLSVAEELTGSKFGYIGEINPAGLLDTIAISNPGWDACEMSYSDATRLIRDMEIRGIDRSLIKEEKSRIVNDLTSHPDRVGAPEGHPLVTSFLGVPMKNFDKTIGMIGLGNKESGYDPADQEAIEKLSVAFVEALNRKRSEIALAESEKRYRDLVEMSPEAVYVHIEGEIVYINSEGTKLFGAITAAELIGRSVFDFSQPDYHEIIKTRIKQTHKEQKPVGWAEMKVIRVDGRVIDIVTNGTAINYSGKPAVMSIVRDITEQKTAERQLRESEAKLQELFDDAPTGYHEYDQKGRITRVNRTELKMLGYSAEEMLGRFVWEFIVEEEVSRKAVKAKLRGKNLPGAAFERSMRRKDGTTFPILVEDRLLKDEQGRITGIRSTLHDITERKRVEQAFREEEEKFRILVEESPLGVSMIGKDGRYLYVNPRFVTMFGYDIEDIPTGRQWFRKAFPDEKYRNQVISMWRNDKKGLKANESRPRKFNVTCKDGTEKVVYFIPVMMETGDEFVLYDDITEHENFAARLQQAQKMEAIGTLAGGIAHDFNNILSAVIGYGELAMDSVTEGSDLKIKLQAIVSAGYRARDLIKQILAFSRQAEQEIKPISIKYIAKEALKLLRASIPSTIEIRDEIRSDKTVMGDPTQIHQVIMNLCTNSAHAMKESGGILELSLEECEILSESEIARLNIPPGQYLKLSIRDTGCGIPADIVDKIFDPFFTTREKGVGTGLGLSVVHGIVKSLGGGIRVDSEPDKGTTFEIYLPAIQTETEAQETVQAILPKGTEHILIVDDEKTVTDIGKESLEKQGYRVTTRTSSIEALELFKVRSREFDLILTDLTMPNMTGLDLSKEIKNIRPDIPIILCSGFAEQISEMSLKEHGIATMVRKPIGKNELFQLVRRVLDMKSDSTD